MSRIIEYIRSDLHRYEGDSSPSALIRHLTLNWCFRYSFWLRLCRAESRVIRLVAKVMHRHLSIKYGIHIPSSTRIGYGLYIGHAVGLVINHTARIGNNCNLSQFTTIGSNHEHAAVIGDNVYIGPGTCIVEDVVIGSNATIGAGAVVVHDVPEGITVAGNPARVISMKQPGRYVRNRWPPASRSISDPVTGDRDSSQCEFDKRDFANRGEKRDRVEMRALENRGSKKRALEKRDLEKRPFEKRNSEKQDTENGVSANKKQKHKGQ